MAKETNTLKFTKATICIKDMTITEYLKDETKTHNIFEILKPWDDVRDVDITLTRDEEV